MSPYLDIIAMAARFEDAWAEKARDMWAQRFHDFPVPMTRCCLKGHQVMA